MLLIVIVSTLLLGYVWGKYDGRVEGYKQGSVDHSLALREQSLVRGSCILCHEDVQNNPTEYPINGLSYHNNKRISHTSKITS